MEITSKNPRQKANIEWLLKTQKENAVYESHLDGAIQVVKYSPKGAYPVAAIFENRKKNPVSHYRYSNESDREQAIQKRIEAELNHRKWKAEKKARNIVEIKVGDILYTSWGYEQTNIDFYKVVDLVGKKTAVYVKIGSEIVKNTSWCSADVKPDPSNIIGQPERGRINEYGVKIGREYGRKTDEKSTHHSSWGY